MTGTKIAHYEITAKLGEGGMGVVYRAKDTKLGRDVAIKVLPPALADDSERMARFHREARVLASLNHPNIAAIHGLEESNGVHALVMELVEGPTLADRLREGAIPLDEALPLAQQIAEALEYAHEQGVVHRDLKPTNVKVTDDGSGKVLDFGLAKAMADDPAVRDPANSPTLTIGATKAGVILGTAAYMAPEQARGKTVDKRADIWAFGVVLYEMLTGKLPFRGEDLTETLASVVKEQPDLGAAPAKVRRLLEKCLEKDPGKRLRDISGVALLLEAPEPPLTQPQRQRLLWALLAVVSLALALVGFLYFGQAPPELQAVHFSVGPPPGSNFHSDFESYAPSPDGRYLVMGVDVGKGNSPSLLLRTMDIGEVRQLATGAAPTWSPDSRSLAFWDGSQLKRIDIDGGAPFLLAEATGRVVRSPGTWNQDGVILIGGSSGLQQVSASEGGAAPLTEVDPDRQETGHYYPQFLPDGDRFLYFVTSEDPNVQGVYLSSLREPSARELVLRSEAKAVYVPPRATCPGYLLWLYGQTLVARRFDPDALAFEGDTVTLADSLVPPVRPMLAPFWASEGGVLMYLPGLPLKRPAIWMDQEGRQLGEAAPTNQYARLDLSPQGDRMVVSVQEDDNWDLWLVDLASGNRRRLTSDPSREEIFTLSPDGSEVAFVSDRNGGVRQIYRKDTYRASEAEPLTDWPNRKLVYDWSPDGQYLLYAEASPETGWDVMLLPLEGDRTPIPVADTIYSEVSSAISPDGRWVAYTSNESGRSEIWVTAFPGTAGAPEGRWQVSDGGGSAPRWHPNSRKIYYQTLDGSAVMAVEIEPGPLQVRPAESRPVLTGLKLAAPLSNQFDVAPDGERFVLFGDGGEQSFSLEVEVNWEARLEQ